MRISTKIPRELIELIKSNSETGEVTVGTLAINLASDDSTLTSAFTVGMSVYSYPEIIATGIDAEFIRHIIDRIAGEMFAAGLVLKDGMTISGILEDDKKLLVRKIPIERAPVAYKFCGEFMTGAFQILWEDEAGDFPNQSKAPKTNQPLLG